MTEQPSLKRRRDDEHPTNPVNPNPPLPDFITRLNVQQQNVIKSVWNSDTLTLSEKIARIDTLEDEMSEETRGKYRRWRFQHDKSSVNAFLEKQKPSIQNHIRLCLSTQSNLDEFYNSMLTLLPSFDDKESFLNWKNSEMLQWNRVLFYMYYDGYYNEGRICLFNSSSFEVELIRKFSTWAWPNEVAIENDQIFLIKGYDKVFEIFNYETKQLTKGPNPPEWRGRATVAYYKNKLYYIGGIDSNDDSSTGEDSNDDVSSCVNILVNGKWQRGPDFPIKDYSARHIICNDKLYIIFKNVLFQLSDDEREWIEVGKMEETRSSPAVASLNGKIYITGGYKSYDTLNSCLCFDPSQPFDRRFTSIENMNYERFHHSLVVANGKLYAIGGYHEGNKFCKSVEEYDPTTNKWKISNNTLLNTKSLSINDTKSSDIPSHNGNKAIVTTPNYRQNGKTSEYNEIYIGIDLGTTYSCVAVVENGQPVAIINSLGERATPSVVSYSDKEILVGNPAINSSVELSSILYDSKRLIGWRILYDLPIAKDRHLWTFNTAKQGDCVGYILNKGADNKNFVKPEEVSAEVLKYLKSIAEKYLNKKITAAVVTIPASFNPNQISATIKAIELAGLKLQSALYEPTAAAIAYNYKLKLQNSKILIYDFGGGTLDVSIIEIVNGKLRIRAASGEPHLGGQDFDGKIMKYAIGSFIVSSNFDVYSNPRWVKRLRNECRKIKEALSTHEGPLNIHLEINDKLELNVKLTREKFNELCEELFARTQMCVDRALNTAQLSTTDIEYVIMVGGSSRIPRIREKLGDQFGESKLKSDINPDEAVALGAAIYANSTQAITIEQTPPSNPACNNGHSTNPNLSLPDFITGLNVQQQAIVKGIWNSDVLTLSEKIVCIDGLGDKMAKETRREYRRWRFQHDKSPVNAFLEKQELTMQNHIRLCLSTQSNLDEFYNSMRVLLPSFDDKESFLNWKNSEMLQWNRVLFYMTYGEDPNYEGIICLFNSSTFEVEIVEKFSTLVIPCEVATGNDQIFLISVRNKVFEIFNYETRQLTKGPDPPEWRGYATVAYYKNKLYYIGGLDLNEQPMTSVNILVNGKWQRGPDFPIKDCSARHIICNDKLYIISENAVFQLSDNEREWIEVGKMKGKRWSPAVASLNGKIYITGGYKSYDTLNSCLCFDPSQPFDRRFTSIANMNYNRYYHSLVVANGKLYAIGGYEEMNKFCESVEEYDPATNQWRIVGEIE